MSKSVRLGYSLLLGTRHGLSNIDQTVCFFFITESGACSSW
jgi:hypothetical protein